MLSTVSHDLKTPLSTIIGSLEIYTRMAEKLSAEKKQLLIQSALGEAYRLDSFITNILDMARLEGGNVQARREVVDLNPLIEDCIKRLGPRANSHHFINECQNFRLHSDPVLLARALGLLLDNATKHAGKQATITISTLTAEELITLEVRDNGPGIPPGREEEIFSKYTRISRIDQQNAGTGLGLAICRHMLTILGGTISASNHPSGGASFKLALPKQEAA